MKLNKITKNRAYYENKDFILNIPLKSGIKQKIKKYITIISYPIRNIFYKALVNLMPLSEEKRKYKLVFCSIFKNEAQFFKEWILYHNMLGVEQFYLYNNNSTDDYQSVLEPFIKDGLVTLIDWPQIPGQIAAYKHWYEHFRKDAEWCSFIDLDEFICPKYDYTIIDWLDKYKKYPALKIDWVMFGSSGKMKHDKEKFVIEQYTSCWNKRGRVGKILYNCIYDVGKITNGSMHLLFTKKWFVKIPPFNDSKNICCKNGYEHVNKYHGSIQMNHYYCKAFDILEEKISRGDAAYKSFKKMNGYKFREMNCVQKDYTIQRFLQLLKITYRKWNLKHSVDDNNK